MGTHRGTFRKHIVEKTEPYLKPDGVNSHFCKTADLVEFCEAIHDPIYPGVWRGRLPTAEEILEPYRER